MVLQIEKGLRCEWRRIKIRLTGNKEGKFGFEGEMKLITRKGSSVGLAPGHRPGMDKGRERGDAGE